MNFGNIKRSSQAIAANDNLALTTTLTVGGLNAMAVSNLSQNHAESKEVELKICSKCGRSLPATLEFFNKKSDRKSGLRPFCIECNANACKAYREANKEKVKAYSVAYNQINKKKRSEYNASYHQKNKVKKAAYYQENKEAICERQAEYRKKNKEKEIERHAKYRKENKEKIAKSDAEYRKKNKEKLREKAAEYNNLNRDKRIEYYYKNREKILKKKAEYRKNNKEKIEAGKKDWYERNKDHVIAKRSEYYKNNKERISQRALEYRQNNKDKIAEYYVRSKERRDTYQKKNKKRMATRKAELLNKGCLYKSKTVQSLKKYEKVIEGDDGKALFECAYCGKKFNPIVRAVSARLNVINGSHKGESRLYCSQSCKKSCPTYGQLKYPKRYRKATSREANPQLRQIVLKRDNYTCQKCGSTEYLHCHHVVPAKQNPMTANDPDVCITLCKKCHKEIHKQDGCKYHELQCKKVS